MKNLNNQFERRDALSRNNFFNRFNFRNQQGGDIFNSNQYNDNPNLDENLLKEMAGAYAKVLSKYGYSVQRDKADFKANLNQNFADIPKNDLNISDKENQKNQVAETDKDLSQASITSERPVAFNDNFDYLANNYLSNDPNYTYSQLQITNDLLVQILNELRTISCLIECNRRRRLS